MKTHLSSLTYISFSPRSQPAILNLAFILRFNFKHGQIQIPIVPVYRSQGYVYINIFVWIRSAFRQSSNCPTCYVLVVIAEQSFRTQTRLLSNDTKPKHALKPLLNVQLIRQN